MPRLTKSRRTSWVKVVTQVSVRTVQRGRKSEQWMNSWTDGSMGNPTGSGSEFRRNSLCSFTGLKMNWCSWEGSATTSQSDLVKKNFFLKWDWIHQPSNLCASLLGFSAAATEHIGRRPPVELGSDQFECYYHYYVGFQFQPYYYLKKSSVQRLLFVSFSDPLLCPTLRVSWAVPGKDDSKRADNECISWTTPRCPHHTNPYRQSVVAQWFGRPVCCNWSQRRADAHHQTCSVSFMNLGNFYSTNSDSTGKNKKPLWSQAAPDIWKYNSLKFPKRADRRWFFMPECTFTFSYFKVVSAEKDLGTKKSSEEFWFQLVSNWRGTPEAVCILVLQWLLDGFDRLWNPYWILSLQSADVLWLNISRRMESRLRSCCSGEPTQTSGVSELSL